ncbi:hypothetical protein [Micromonospora sp. IBHARD004]|uniref:hypothetical protein n=1 Tax=Micromonospora sp. IBHARD004 TaxID=3457764 RepID=UPI0040592754
MPGAFELVSADQVRAPVLLRVIKADLTQTSILVFLMIGPVAEYRASVVCLHLADRPAAVIDLEVPDGVSPTVELVASAVIPTTAKVRLGMTKAYGGSGTLICRDVRGPADARD